MLKATPYKLILGVTLFFVCLLLWSVITVPVSLVFALYNGNWAFVFANLIVGATVYILSVPMLFLCYLKKN